VFESVSCPICGEGYPAGRPEAQDIKDFRIALAKLHGQIESLEKDLQAVTISRDTWMKKYAKATGRNES
jgi:hypothetical protein